MQRHCASGSMPSNAARNLSRTHGSSQRTRARSCCSLVLAVRQGRPRQGACALRHALSAHRPRRPCPRKRGNACHVGADGQTSSDCRMHEYASRNPQALYPRRRTHRVHGAFSGEPDCRPEVSGFRAKADWGPNRHQNHPNSRAKCLNYRHFWGPDGHRQHPNCRALSRLFLLILLHFFPFLRLMPCRVCINSRVTGCRWVAA